jgi:CRISPR-associated endonuclease Csn1
MSELTLGLDLGPNSLGWALLDEPGQRIVAAGVRVFPEGVDRDARGAEIPKMQQRRIARAMRRQIARRSRRKLRLRRALVRAGLLPPSGVLGRDDPARAAWESEQFRRADPYTLRARALREPLQPHEVGRVLLHLGQRRGFQSNRRTDRARPKESSEMLAEISALEAKLGGHTLGEHLATLRGSDPALFHTVRLRGQHTRRDMYRREFDAIWTAQQHHNPELFSEALRCELAEIIFFQRELRAPGPGLVGRCELEPRLPRCPRADRRAQRFRLLQEVNNLRVIDLCTRVERALSGEERSKLLTFLASKKERSFDDIRRHLFAEYENVQFNLERGDRKKLKGLPSDAALAHRNLLGKAWAGLDQSVKDQIVSGLIDDDESRLRHALQTGGLDPDSAPRLLDGVTLEEGYSSYSLHAIRRLLPHLADGLPLTSRDASVPCAMGAAGYALPWEHQAQKRPFLPEAPFLTNPLVRQALHEVRKVVNGLLREVIYKSGHNLARIHIELVRSVRGSAQERARYSREIRQRQDQRTAAAEEIAELGIKPTRDAVDRYLLWSEQDRTCIYSGEPISLAQLFGGEVDIDHILPYGRSLDNSMMNKVVALRTENESKRDRTPHEWLAATDPDKYDQVLQRTRRLPFAKRRRVLAESISLDDFFARHFIDTAYITTQVHQYVQCLGADVLCPKGQHTAELRYHWGLDTVLSELADGPAWLSGASARPGEKNRADHRHHAIDAIVIALTSRSRLQQLASLRRRGGVEQTGEILDEAWLRPAVLDCVRSINVSHRVSRRVSGPLHEETIYGPTASAGEFVYRKPVQALTPAMLDDIRDPVVRDVVRAHVEARVDLRQTSRIPADVWKEYPTLASGVAIRRVRLVKRDETIRPIRAGTACVKPGSLHHLCLFELPPENGEKRRDAVFVSTLDAIGRIRARQPIIQRMHPQRPDARLIMSLSANELVLLRHDGREELYRFETAASTTQQMWFRHHTFAGPSSDKRGRVSKRPGTLECRKVVVDPLGRIRRASD